MDDRTLFDDNMTDHLQFGFHGAQPSCGYDEIDPAVFDDGSSLSESYEANPFPAVHLERQAQNDFMTGQPIDCKQAQGRADMSLSKASMGINSNSAAPMAVKAPSQASDASPKSEARSGFAPSPPSAQTKIISQRESVGQRFGQVTPPDEVVKLGIGVPPKRTKSSSEEADAQRQRQERARNAAHTRHARNSSSRKSRKDSRDDANVGDDDQDEEPGDGKREKYREKNRLAAAKCRSKKKASVSDLEERHRIMAAENNFRRREERELRDQLTTLRTMALEHGPDRCRCGDVHQYNQTKAAEMAFGHRFSGGPKRVMGSPSQESTALSQISDFAPTFDDHQASVQDGMDLGMMASSMRPQSSTVEASIANGLNGSTIGSPMDDDPMLSMSAGHDDFPMFANFLQSSPGAGGRPGFA